MRTTLAHLAPGLLAICLLQGCASQPAKPEWQMQPLLRISDAAGYNAAAYYQLGRQHQQQGRYELAGAAYARSITLDGRQLEARNALATLDALHQALALDPGNEYARHNLAQVAARGGAAADCAKAASSAQRRPAIAGAEGESGDRLAGGWRSGHP